jgi:hypothetical protein
MPVAATFHEGDPDLSVGLLWSELLDCLLDLVLAQV